MSLEARRRLHAMRRIVVKMNGWRDELLHELECSPLDTPVLLGVWDAAEFYFRHYLNYFETMADADKEQTND